MDPTIRAEKGGTSSHKKDGLSSNKKCNNPNLFTISSHYPEKVQMLHSSIVYSFIHVFTPKVK